jgi:photosystem II stability/assembly factor-like uncharacterized protein
MKNFASCLLPLLMAPFLWCGCASDNSPSTPYNPPSPPQTIRGSWTWQNPLPQGNQLTDISFVDAANGWAVGIKNTILHTTDGGVTWTSQGEGTSYMLTDVFALDANTAWAVGTPYYCAENSSMHGSILHTGNAGLTWTEYPLNTEIGYSPRDLCFADAQNGWLVSSGDVFRTTDGGQHWTVCALSWVNVIAVTSLGHDDVWAVGIQDYDGRIVHSTDGGNQWTTVDILPDFTFNDICFADANTGWAVTAPENDTLVIRQTTDGGGSWITVARIRSHYGNAPQIQFTTPSIGWTWPSNGLMRTTDGGRTWTEVTAAGGSLVNTFVGENLGWQAMGDGHLRHTSDGGNSWEDQGGPSYFNQISGIVFIDEHEGWCVDGNSAYRTTDGGRAWETQNLSQFFYPYAIKFNDAFTGWIISGTYSSPQMARTTDAGRSWNTGHVETPGNQGLKDFCFVDRLNGWALGQMGAVIRTRDGGISWAALPCSTTTQPLRIAFADTLRGRILYQGLNSFVSILHTTDGGLSWNATDYPYLQRAFDMMFKGPESGWIVGGNGLILHSVNAGESWTIQSTGTWENFRCVYCVSPDFVWIGSECGTVYVTVDRGQSWQRLSTPSSLPFTAITAVNSAHAWAVGYNSSLLHFTPDQAMVLGQE